MHAESERTRTFTWHDPLVAMAAAHRMTGRSYLDALREGRLPAPPMVELMGFELREVGDGCVVFTATPQEYYYNGIGLMHGGFAATLLDTTIGCAVLTTVPAEKVATTLDLQVRYFRPLTMQSGTLRCEGRVINIGRSTTTAEGQIFDGAGRLCGHGTSTLALIVPDARHFPALER